MSYQDLVSSPLACNGQTDALDAENVARRARGAPPVTLINDCCLAFSVLVHNPSLRLLDLTASAAACATPVIVTLDAHKHLGTDKGVSTVVGSPRTLSFLRGRVRCGAQPTKVREDVAHPDRARVRCGADQG